MKHSYLIGEQKTGVGTRRKLHHLSGFRLQETVTEWTAGRSFSFDVIQAPFPMKEVREAWGIEHSNGQTTVATSVGYSMHLGFLGLVLDALVVQHIVRRENRSGLVGLKRYAERSLRQTKEP
jgi:ligand-binding SRPBCC domain-containing protein